MLKRVKLFIHSLTLSTLALLMMFSVPAFASATPASSQSTPDLLVRQIMGLAYESQQSINSVPFSVGDSLRKVVKEWGQPEDLSTVAANYWSRHVRFLYDGSTGRKTITAIEDFDPQLQTIHLSDVKGLLGNPVSEKEQEGNYYVTYTDNENYTVIFVFESAWINPDPALSMYIVQKPTPNHQ
ncbi:protein of unknown function [Lihuaxuella thermophila]|uniref:DUF4309 domain-containing protein n=1 Tax=Lihuaxuella thermophila TaxID=1173111 RepID=A0A1H8G8P9_9BACL|nr:protein of unknown function [Lihuaxuella thermophila]